MNNKILTNGHPQASSSHGGVRMTKAGLFGDVIPLLTKKDSIVGWALPTLRLLLDPGRITLSGKDGNNAKPDQEKEVQEAIKAINYPNPLRARLGFSVALEILQDRTSEPPGWFIEQPHFLIIKAPFKSASPIQPQN